jgi:pimeloyl-ACP methyl ester carboxylesterase
VLPELERHHDVLALTLPGHAGGPPLDEPVSDDVMADAVERAMEDAGFDTAHIAGNSLGGYLALQLAARGRARSVVAFAPAGGWAVGDESYKQALSYFETMQGLLEGALPHVDTIVSTPEGRRRATTYVAENYEHLSPDLVAHLMRGAGNCDAVFPLVDYARREGWKLDAEKIECPVRVVWGTADRLLEWPSAAARYRHDWVPAADWVELEGVGHCPQLDVPLEAAQLIVGFTAE